MPDAPRQPDDRQFDALRELLAQKRAEQPPKPLMDNFVAEFHRRLADDRAAQLARRANRPWLRLLEWIGLPPSVPGDEAFATLRRLLSLKRYERPAAEYFAGFVAQFHRRLRESEMTGTGFASQLRALIADRPFAVAQFAGACLVAALLGLSAGAYQYMQHQRGAQFAAAQRAPIIVASAVNESAAPVHYVFDNTDTARDEAPDPSVFRIPATPRMQRVQFVMDHVEPHARIHEASYNF
jgi:hypothetical protein